MENIDIKYSDIQTLMLEYRNNIGKNLNQFSTLMNDINALVGDKVDFAGQGAENIRNYYAQIHLTLLTGIMEAMQAMLSEVAVYKDGYDSIDGSEDFHYNENASEDLHTELEFQSAQMNTYHQEVRENLLNIADLFEEYEPSNESVQFNISETLNEMDRMSEEVESHESNTKKHLNDIKEVLLRLTSMISDANSYSANVVEYDGSLPFKMEDILAFYNGYKKLDSRISETGDIMERVFKEEDKRLAAEQRKNQGLLEMAEAAMIIVVGGALCVASAGAATPLVAVGFATLGTTTAAFGIADAVEGTQDFYYGAGGDGSTRAVNPLRDTLFMENDDLYNICESVTVTAASVSLPVAAAGTATVKGFARSAFEYGVSGLAGQGSSYLAYKATGDKNIANIANIVGSTVVGGRLAGENTKRKINIVKNKFKGNIKGRCRGRVDKSGSKTISQVDRSKIIAWDYTPDDELYLKCKDVFDNPKYYNQETGAINWPENNGFAHTPIDEVLQPGTRIDRYGSDFGSFVSPEGTPYEMRAVAPGTDQRPYSIFEVVEPINIKSGSIAPWFSEPGGGIQYLLPDTVDELLDAGILRRIK